MGLAAVSGEQCHLKTYFTPVGSISCSWDSKNLKVGAVVSGWQSHGCNAQRNKCNQKQSTDTRTIVQTVAI